MPSFWRRVEDFRQRNGPGSFLWSFEVNNRGGALIAFLLNSTHVTPNWVTVAGLIVHLSGSVYVGLLVPPVSVAALLPPLIVWQMAYCLDCADGLLARERGQTSQFGAWLDQMADAVAHVSVFVALTVFLARAVALPPVLMLVLLGSLIGANLTLLFGWTLRVMLMGQPDQTPATAGWRLALPTVLRLGVAQACDYGLFLFVSSFLLLFPRALLFYVSALAFLWAGSVAALAFRLGSQGSHAFGAPRS